jgi:hypothetical protein
VRFRVSLPALAATEPAQAIAILISFSLWFPLWIGWLKIGLSGRLPSAPQTIGNYINLAVVA